MKWFQHRNVDTEGLGSPPGCSTTCVMIGHHTVIWQRDRGDATESSRTFQGIRVPIPRNMKTKFPKSFLVSTARVVGAGRETRVAELKVAAASATPRPLEPHRRKPMPASHWIQEEATLPPPEATWKSLCSDGTFLSLWDVNVDEGTRMAIQLKCGSQQTVGNFPEANLLEL
eukprot:1671132-Rhodomonas_salina.1